MGQSMSSIPRAVFGACRTFIIHHSSFIICLSAGLALRRAQKAWRRGDHRQAEELFEYALSFGVTDSRPYVQYASALLEQGWVDRATELLANAVEVEPGNPVPFVFLGLAHSDSGRQVEACAALQEAAKLAPGNLLPKSCLALVRMRSGQARQAAAGLLKEGVADNPRVRGRIMVEAEKSLRRRTRPPLFQNLIPAAVDEQEHAAPDAGWSGRRSFREGLRAFREGRFRAARACFDAAREQKFNADEATLYSAGARLGLGDYAGSADVLLAIPGKGTIRGVALFYAAVARCCTGDYPAARDLIDRAVESGNVHDLEEYISYYRGLCLLDAGDELAARRAFADAAEIDPALLVQRLSEAAS